MNNKVLFFTSIIKIISIPNCMNNSLKIALAFFLLLAIAIVLQSYLIYIDTDEVIQLLSVPALLTFLSIVIWIVSEKKSAYKKAFKVLSILFIIAFVLWFIFVQYAIALGSGWNH